MADPREKGDLAPGLRPDGTLVTIEPGQPIPEAKIVTPDGRELAPAELDDEEGADDLSDLDDLDDLLED